MKTKESQHYKYYFVSKSLAEKEIDKIIGIQEVSYAKILGFLGVSNDRIIKYYIYPSKKMKFDRTGDDGNGHANRKKYEVYVVYNEDIKCIGPHEDTHLLTTSLGMPPQLLREGLAEYMSGAWHGLHHDDWAKRYLNNKLIINIASIIDDDNWYESDDMVTYPCAGSFVGFLVFKFGKNKFLRLYKELSRDFDTKKNMELFEKVVGKDIEKIQLEWQKYLLADKK